MNVSFSGAAQAQNLDAGAVLDQMTTTEKSHFLGGIIEGLAYARFLQDKPNEEGMICVQNWFYDQNGRKERLAELYQLFENYREYPVAVLVNSQVKKKCGE